MEEEVMELLLTSSDNEISSSSTSSSSTSTDSFATVLNLQGALLNRENRHAVDKYAENTIEAYSDKEFVTHLRLSRTVTMGLINAFENSQIYKNLSSVTGLEKIAAKKHVYVFLWFVGHEASSYRDISDRFNISPSTLFLIITRVSHFLCSLPMINWPTAEEANRTKDFFMRKYNFPNIIGIVDGTHVKINRPKHDPDSYINRKHYYSIQIQLVCNENRKVIDAFIGYPGSVHDARVYRNSPLSSMALDHFYGGYLIGDSAYPCRRSLIVPYRDNGHLSHRQKVFNQRLSTCRIVIEHTNGLLKQRFRQLYHLNMRNIPRLCMIIKSCIILHNLANEKDLTDEEIGEIMQRDFTEEDEDLFNDVDARLATGAALRDEIVL